MLDLGESVLTTSSLRVAYNTEKLARFGPFGSRFWTESNSGPLLWSERLLFNGMDFIIGISARWERS